jgi:hypothetical protein
MKRGTVDKGTVRNGVALCVDAPLVEKSGFLAGPDFSCFSSG